jgi:hypothetical protein
MNGIREKDYAIFLLSENYLSSEYGLYEFSVFMSKNEFGKSALPVILPDFKIEESVYNRLLERLRFWKFPKRNSFSFFDKIKSRFLTSKRRVQQRVQLRKD